LFISHWNRKQGRVIGIELRNDQHHCRYFISTLQRAENEVPRDLFQFTPTFVKLPNDTPEPAKIKWETVLTDVTEIPPASLLYQPPEVEIGEAGTL